MQKKFISNLILIIVLNLLIKPIAIFGIDASVQNKVGAENYGIYFSLLNLSFLFNIILDLGINNFTTKHIAQYPHIVSRYMGKLLTFRILLFLVYAAITLLSGFILNYDAAAFGMLIFFIFNQFLATLIAYFRSHFSGLLLFKSEALISVLDRLLLIIFVGLAFVFIKQPFKIEWFIWIQTGCYFLVAIISFSMLIRQIGLPKFTWHWTFSKAIIKQSFPYALLIILMMFYTRIDSVMIERMHIHGKEQAGIYAQGYRLLDAAFIFGMIFSNLLYPLFSKQIKERISVLPLLKTGGNLLIGGSLLLAFFCYLNSEWILSLIYENEVQQSVMSFKYLMLSFVGMSFTLIFGTLLTANGSMKFLNTLSFFGIVVNVSLNYFLIPTYGASGAAIATFCTQSFIALIQFIYCAYCFDFQISFRSSLNYVGLLAGLVIIYFSFENYSASPFLIFFELLIGVILLLVTKMINLGELKKHFSKSLEKLE